ncbi:MAG TPA: hypothetical protein VJU61_28575 [Polyangiaceae bacterium]|nr:hypothetical protein [Polyangiaceae bacterium]
MSGRQLGVLLGAVAALALACAVDDRVVSSPNTEALSPALNPPVGGTALDTEEAAPSAPPATVGGGGSAGSAGANGAAPILAPATLTLFFDGDGAGEVTLSAPGMATERCSADCQIQVPSGSIVTAAAVARPPYSALFGWSTEACRTLQNCPLSVEGAVNVRVSFQLRYNVAFTSSRDYDLSQLPKPGVEANAECARLAAAGGVHGTRWVAWLAAEGPTTAESDDITPGQFFQNDGGWLRRDGVPIARSRAALLAGETLNPLNLTELGEPTDANAWSGATISGALNRSSASADCNNWSADGEPGRTAAAAKVGAVGNGRATRAILSCAGRAPIQCFGDDPALEVPVFPVSGRIAFGSNASVIPGGGIAAFDAVCQRDACLAGLSPSSDGCVADLGTRSFLSYLHTSQQPAWERFDVDGPDWVRVDGIPWLSPASLLASDAKGRSTGLNLTAAGTFIPGTGATWLGRSNGELTCGDWTLNVDQGLFFLAGEAARGFPLSGETQNLTNCSAAARLMCLEE